MFRIDPHQRISVIPHWTDSGIMVQHAGRVGGVLPCYYVRFDGVDDYIQFAAWPNIWAGDWAVEMWIRPDNTQAEVVGTILNIGTVPNNGLTVSWSRTTSLVYFSYEKATIFYNRRTNNTAPSGTWTHIAGQWVNATSSLTVYRNGAADSVASFNLASDANANRLGKWGADDTRDYKGDLGAFWISTATRGYPKANPLSPVTADGSHIVVYNLRNEGGAGVTADDESSSANDGTFKGAGEPAWQDTMVSSGPGGWSD